MPVPKVSVLERVDCIQRVLRMLTNRLLVFQMVVILGRYELKTHRLLQVFFKSKLTR